MATMKAVRLHRFGGPEVLQLDEVPMPQSQELARRHDARGLRFLYHPDGAQLAEIGRLIDEGRIRVHVERSFPLDRVGEAQQLLENEHVRGKMVLQAA